MSKWLEDQLSRHLGPARAPDGLWERLQHAAQPPRAAAPLPLARWSAAAVLILAATAGSLWLPASNPDFTGRRIAFVVRETPAPHSSPQDWKLRCAFPAGNSVFQLAAYPALRFPPETTSAPTWKYDSADCHRCHASLPD
jgi:hypothetical protein